MKTYKYKCPKCKKVIEYDHDNEYPTDLYTGKRPKKWIQSYCESKDIDTRITLIN